MVETLEYADYIEYRRVRLTPHHHHLNECSGTRVNFIWWWGSSPEALRDDDFIFHYSQVHSEPDC